MIPQHTSMAPKLGVPSCPHALTEPELWGSSDLLVPTGCCGQDVVAGASQVSPKLWAGSLTPGLPPCPSTPAPTHPFPKNCLCLTMYHSAPEVSCLPPAPLPTKHPNLSVPYS